LERTHDPLHRPPDHLPYEGDSLVMHDTP